MSLCVYWLNELNVQMKKQVINSLIKLMKTEAIQNQRVSDLWYGNDRYDSGPMVEWLDNMHNTIG